MKPQRLQFSRHKGFNLQAMSDALNGLPALYHPLFNAPNFRDGATTDKFFLCLEALDPKFDLVEAKKYLESFQPVSVVEVAY